MLYMVTFTINIPQMLAYIPYMDPMGSRSCHGQKKKPALLTCGSSSMGSLRTCSRTWRHTSNRQGDVKKTDRKVVISWFAMENQ